MKKLCILLLALLFTIAGYAQTIYWTVYHFEVKPGFENEIAGSFDRFFESETGKDMPYAAFGANMFSSSKDRWTHEVVFASPNKEDFGKMYSGMLQQSADFSVMIQSMDRGTDGVASYLGKSIISEPNPEEKYSTIYELSVSDPAAYVAAFSEMRTALKAKIPNLGLHLHQFISGNEKDATHVVVASAATFDELLGFTDTVFASDEFATFAGKVKDIRKILRVFTTITLKEYNVPEGM